MVLRFTIFFSFPVEDETREKERGVGSGKEGDGDGGGPTLRSRLSVHREREEKRTERGRKKTIKDARRGACTFLESTKG